MSDAAIAIPILIGFFILFFFLTKGLSRLHERFDSLESLIKSRKEESQG